MAGRGAGLTPTERFVGYERVSTARQGASGLGLAAQRSAIEGYARSRGVEVAAIFTEVESGRKADRPELARAIQHARLTGSTLLIARLDRLSRNAEASARDLTSVLAEIRAEGAITLRGIAAALKERGVLHRRGAAWGVSNVRNLIARLR